MKNGKKNKKIDPSSSTLQKDRRESDKEVAFKAYELIEPLCDAEGVELIHVECQRESGGRILRIYIDKPGGVTLDDCADISRQAGDILDVSFENNWSYNLEVSSPGFDRPLVKLRDFERFKGLQVKMRIDQPLNGQKNFRGILLGISDDYVNVSIDDRTVNIPFKGITKARLVG
jgi:ribosome maturation factor RimP